MNEGTKKKKMTKLRWWYIGTYREVKEGHSPFG